MLDPEIATPQISEHAHHCVRNTLSENPIESYAADESKEVIMPQVVDTSREVMLPQIADESKDVYVDSNTAALPNSNEIPEKEPIPRVIVLLDADGSIFPSLHITLDTIKMGLQESYGGVDWEEVESAYLNALEEANHGLLDWIHHMQQAASVTVGSFSARSSLRIDQLNSARNCTLSFFWVLDHLAQKCGWVLDRFLLADLYGAKSPGHSWASITEHPLSKFPLDIDDFPVGHAEDPSRIIDEQKFLLLYAWVHYAMMTSDEPTVLYVVDDRDDILDGLYDRCIQQAQHFPSTIKVVFMHHGYQSRSDRFVDKCTQVHTFEGSGDANPYFQRVLKAFDFLKQEVKTHLSVTGLKSPEAFYALQTKSVDLVFDYHRQYINDSVMKSSALSDVYLVGLMIRVLVRMPPEWVPVNSLYLAGVAAEISLFEKMDAFERSLRSAYQARMPWSVISQEEKLIKSLYADLIALRLMCMSIGFSEDQFTGLMLKFREVAVEVLSFPALDALHGPMLEVADQIEQYLKEVMFEEDGHFDVEEPQTTSLFLGAFVLEGEDASRIKIPETFEDAEGCLMAEAIASDRVSPSSGLLKLDNDLDQKCDHGGEAASITQGCEWPAAVALVVADSRDSRVSVDSNASELGAQAD